MKQKIYLDKLIENKEFKEKFKEEYKIIMERENGLGCINTDKNLWRKVEGDYYSPSIHVTEDGNIGINVGGHVIIMPIEKWFLLGYDNKEK